MSKLAILAVAVCSCGLAVTPAHAQVEMDVGGGYTYTIDNYQLQFTCAQSGTCDSQNAPERFQICSAVAPDLLAERILYALGALGLCHGYTDANYRAFLSDVPPAQHYAVNYLHYGFGEPLLSAREAQAIEAQDFPRMAMLPGAPPVPGGVRHVTPEARSGPAAQRGRKSVTANRPDGRECAASDSSSVRWGGVDWTLNDCAAEQTTEQDASADQVGACGLPYANAAQREEQEIHAKYGTCADIGGRPNGAVTNVPNAGRSMRAVLADGGELGACGVPYADDYGREEQVFVAEEGACAEYVAEIEAEGY